MSDALLGSSVRAWRIPSRRQVAGERQQCVTVDLRAERGGGIVPSNPILGMSDPLQRRVPAGFEFARDQTLGRIDEFVAPGSQGGVVARFLEFPVQRLPDFVVGLLRLIGGLDGGVDGVL